jgi:hypothetical protein
MAKGQRVDVVAWALKSGENHTFSVTICGASWMLVPWDFWYLARRQQPAPPAPDSWGRVSAILGSRAPATKALLPLREQPVTPIRVGPMCVLDCCFFEGVDDAGDAPGPGGEGAGVVGGAVEVVEFSSSAGVAVGSGGDVVVVEGVGGDAGGDGDGGGAVGDDGGVGAGAGGDVGDGVGEGDGFSVLRGGDGEEGAGPG